MSTVVGLLDDRIDAEDLIEDLIEEGFRREDISLVTNDKIIAGESESERKREVQKKTGAGMAIGGLGGLLLGVTAVIIPGIGPVLGAGPLASGLISGGLGAAGGGIVGALTKKGIPEDQSHCYAEGVRRGCILVAVDAEESEVNRVVEIMDDHGAVDIDTRSVEWRNEGWSRFDETAEPYVEHREEPRTTVSAGKETAPR